MVVSCCAMGIITDQRQRTEYFVDSLSFILRRIDSRRRERLIEELAEIQAQIVGRFP